MKLQKATENDINNILELHNNLFDYKYSYDNYHYELDLDISDFMVLKNDDEIIGFFIVHSIFEQLEIVMIAISNNYQYQGYGQFLMNYIEYLMIKNGCQEIILEVSCFNEKAINFYKKNRFELISQRNDYYSKNNHALIFRK
ncbi:ribosomal protein S18 acetylase RimI-like enzyme [Bacilli bacterium PM5-3]|nr:ribosomal protein S18 acetylase RimI-like enzyme [Bacilli bacterium PM5-3]MDH6602883.1 ribosomal protein S18 acetylase RimI-like enzyme [Bacilli bacterium PM5-9]